MGVRGGGHSGNHDRGLHPTSFEISRAEHVFGLSETQMCLYSLLAVFVVIVIVTHCGQMRMFGAM